MLLTKLKTMTALLLILSMVTLTSVMVMAWGTSASLGLDWCHAVHHIGLALEPLLTGDERKRVFKKLRKWLKAGRWQKVVDELVTLAAAAHMPEKSKVWTEIAYLDRHGGDGHMNYATYRRRRLPLGSGAIESAIRRVSICV